MTTCRPMRKRKKIVGDKDGCTRKEVRNGDKSSFINGEDTCDFVCLPGEKKRWVGELYVLENSTY